MMQKNRQGKPWGTGTTSNARRQRRLHLQRGSDDGTSGDGPPGNGGPGGDRDPSSNRDAPTTTAPRNRGNPSNGRDMMLLGKGGPAAGEMVAGASPGNMVECANNA